MKTTRPITLERYRVTLRRLTLEDIEMLRRWRTDPRISQYMDFRGEITPEQQRAWFDSLDPECDFFFVIVVREKPIGMIEIKHIDWNKKVGEGGIFIYEQRYQNSIVPYCALVSLLEFCFEDLELTAVEGSVLRDNERARRFAKSLGYEILPDQERGENQRYCVTSASFEAAVGSIRARLRGGAAKSPEGAAR